MEDADPGRCARCGACVPVCPVAAADGRESSSARGKLHLLARGLTDSVRLREILARCLLCGRCQRVCSRGLDITGLIRARREKFPPLAGPHGLEKSLIRRALASPSLLRKLIRAGTGLDRIGLVPSGSGLRLRLGLIEQGAAGTRPASNRQPVAGEADVLYFTGCLAAHLQPSIAGAVQRLLAAAGHGALIPDQGCCGLAALSAGHRAEARRLAWANILAFGRGRAPILTSCRSCFVQLTTYPDLFADDPRRRERAEAFAARVREVSAFLLEQPPAFGADPPLRVHYHRPCHQGQGGRDPVPELLARVPGLRLSDPGEGSRCCGQGGLFTVGHPELSARIFQACARPALASRPDLVTTTCSGCLMQWQTQTAASGLKVRVVHPLSLLAERLAGEKPCLSAHSLLCTTAGDTCWGEEQ